MTEWVMPAIALGCVGLSAVRWLRVAQREHYLPGSVAFLRRLWITCHPLNAVEGALVVAGVIGFALYPDSAWPLLGCASIAVFPLGLGLRGRTSTLHWTARLKRTAGLIAVLLLAASALLAWLATTILGGGWAAALTLSMVVCWYAVPDLALGLAVPLERWLSQRFVLQAVDVLKGVGPVVVGITGSYGKTSTKWYARDLMNGSLAVVASPASFNNRLGLARAINENLVEGTQIFLAEMGTYQPGEIAEICSWLPPRVSVLTAIGPVHLQRFKSVERTLRAKAEILETAEVAIVNVDHPLLAQLADNLGSLKVWRCGSSDAATDVRVSRNGDGLAILVHGHDLGVRIPTGPFAPNLACAVAVALELGVPPETVAERALRLTPSEHRQTVGRSTSGTMIIDDTFNSNPAGAARALEVLAASGDGDSIRAVVTPGMVELGPLQAEANRDFAAAAASQAEFLVVVGRTNRKALVEGGRSGSAKVVLVSSRDEAVAWVRDRLGTGDAVLYENDLPDHYP